MEVILTRVVVLQPWERSYLVIVRHWLPVQVKMLEQSGQGLDEIQGQDIFNSRSAVDFSEAFKAGYDCAVEERD